LIKFSAEYGVAGVSESHLRELLFKGFMLCFVINVKRSTKAWAVDTDASAMRSNIFNGGSVQESFELSPVMTAERHCT
jgi:hypothetical protein